MLAKPSVHSRNWFESRAILGPPRLPCCRPESTAARSTVPGGREGPAASNTFKSFFYPAVVWCLRTREAYGTAAAPGF
eukprot:SAG22_NODE_627_length_8410_cov_9.212249_3_plen_78_part_00